MYFITYYACNTKKTTTYNWRSLREQMNWHALRITVEVSYAWSFTHHYIVMLCYMLLKELHTHTHTDRHTHTHSLAAVMRYKYSTECLILGLDSSDDSHRMTKPFSHSLTYRCFIEQYLISPCLCALWNRLKIKKSLRSSSLVRFNPFNY